MTTRDLEKAIQRHFSAGSSAVGDASAMEVFLELRAALERGEVRAASPDESNPVGWSVNAWVKQGILLGFRIGALQDIPGPVFSYVDKETYPTRRFAVADGVRLVPGGSSIRAGSYVARGVVCMPPMYINAGAWVDEGTMVDSHALVGSCAQIGKRVHLSAAAQIGGVLEPINASPVVIEDDVLVGGNTGVYEGTIVRKGGCSRGWDDSDAWNSRVRSGQRNRSQGERNTAAHHSRERGRGSGVARRFEGQGTGMGTQPLCAGDREVSG